MWKREHPLADGEFGLEPIALDKFCYRTRAAYVVAAVAECVVSGFEEGELIGVGGLTGLLSLAFAPLEIYYTWRGTFDKNSNHYIVKVPENEPRLPIFA